MSTRLELFLFFKHLHAEATSTELPRINRVPTMTEPTHSRSFNECAQCNLNTGANGGRERANQETPPKQE
jgi:hypothetical protein